jgi:outer membrane protein TolC
MKQSLIILTGMIFLSSTVHAMDLSESIEYSLKNNPTVIAAQKKAAAAGARLNQAVSAFFPTIDLDGNYDQSYSSPATVQITTGGVTQTYQFGTNATANVTGYQAQLSQPIFVASLFPGYGIAKKGADSSNQEYQQTVVNTTFNVSQTYFGVLRAQKYAVLMDEALQMATAHRQQVQSMFKAGTVTRADLLRSKVREANANVSLIESRYDIELAKDAFNNALGNNMKQPVDLKEMGFTGKVGNLPDYDSLLSMAYDSRPDWKAYLLSVGISEDQVRLAQSEYWPSIMLNADSGNQLTQYPTFQSNVNSWKVMGSGSWTLFDSLGREGRISEAAENLSAQRAQVDQVKNNIAQAVHDAYLSLKSSLDVVIATQQAVESATESLKDVTSSYNAGMGTNVDVLDALVDFTQAQTDHLDALYNVEVAKAKINQVVGTIVL